MTPIIIDHSAAILHDGLLIKNWSDDMLQPININLKVSQPLQSMHLMHM